MEIRNEQQVYIYIYNSQGRPPSLVLPPGEVQGLLGVPTQQTSSSSKALVARGFRRVHGGIER